MTGPGMTAFSHQSWWRPGALFLMVCWSLPAAELPNLLDIPPDLTIPTVSDGPPAAGRRVAFTPPSWEGKGPAGFLYLPPEWKPGLSLPLIVEFPGNGDYHNALGDVSSGLPEDCQLGYGLSGGKGSLWLCLPYLERAPQGEGDRWQVAKHWWGDRAATRQYCLDAVRAVCQDLSGDGKRVLLAGFSRGAIGVHYLGLQDDEIASLWSAFLCHSHYDGVRSWGQPGDDAASARIRLARRGTRPEWISHEGTVAATRAYLEASGESLEGMTLVALPFPNHNAGWVLRDLPERRQLREWYATVIAPRNP